ncbi:MAG: diphthamide biosynthesis enzyme Dph2 [Methanolinea sp.]|nr:diphthamide biosynthesis enzyme Dph2 [Methanolinea sp.]
MTGYSELAGELRRRNVRSIALQFPEGMKRKAREIALFLRKEGFSVIVSADPCYGACDLASDALRLVDALVHFGHTPLGDPDPKVIFEPVSVDFDLGVLKGAVHHFMKSTIGLVTTAQHVHLLPAMVKVLADSGIGAVTRPGSRGCSEGQILGCAFEAARIPSVEEILYVGTGIFHPLGVRLATGKRVIALDPITGTAREVDEDRFLRKRFALIEKARSADAFGFIVSSKTGQNRLSLAREMASGCPNAVILLMREVDPGELLNLGFPAYVNFACPRLAYDDQPRFPAPVLTPQEFRILTGETDFSSYTIDEMQ